MEHSWRLRPPIQGNALCPTCSFPHFPFCPSQPLDGNHRPFPPYNTTIPPHNIPQNVLAPPQIPESWLRNRFQMLPSFPPPPHLGNPIGGGFSCDDERIHKRTRIENVGNFPQISPVLRNDEIGISFEDERRLNLIRDHGGRFVPASLLRPDFHYVHEEQRRIGNLDQLGFGSRKGTDSDYIFPSAQNPYEEDELYRREYSSGSRMQFHSNGFISDQSYGFRIRDGIGKGPNYTLKIEQQQDTHYNQQEAPLHLRQSFAGPGPVQQQISDSAFDHITQGFDGKYQIYDNDRILATPVEESEYKVKYRSSSSLVIQNEEFRKPVEQSAHWNMSNQGAYMLASSRGSMGSAAVAQELGSKSFDVRSPLPPLPPQHFPGDPSRPSVPFLQAATSSPLIVSSVNVSSSVPRATLGFPVHPLTKTPSNNKPQHPVLGGFSTEGLQISQQTSSTKYPEVGQTYPLKYPAVDKPKFVDAAHLFKQPHRATRPDHIVVILRGLPGSGKSYLAKLLRDLEVENGGNAPRIHSMDDYFMTEVEKVEETEGSKSSSTLVRGKRKITKVMEYCYEPEMEEDYRSSMLKAFKKTLEEGIFTFIIVDDRNLRVADFSQFWATAKRSGYEVYLLEAAYKDPLGCAARNVHGFTSDDIQKMADQWEQAPSLYLQLEVKSLFRGDLNGDAIQEVDMDMEDASGEEESKSELQDGLAVKSIKPPSKVDVSDVLSKPGEGWETEGDEPSHEVKELGRSKWSEDVDEDIERKEGSKGHLDSLSGLIQVYSKGAKSVHWGDQSGKRGFSIGAAKKSKISLIIGPGAGYNLNSNPLPEEEKGDAIEGNNKSEPKRRTAFLEQLRAERESFKVVFDRRRQRIGLEMEDD